jgi:hypothetical protein
VRWLEPNEDAPGGVPLRLRRFVPDDWPGATIWQQHDRWKDAREAHAAEHGEWVETLTELLASFELVPDEPFDWDAI